MNPPSADHARPPRLRLGRARPRCDPLSGYPPTQISPSRSAKSLAGGDVTVPRRQCLERDARHQARFGVAATASCVPVEGESAV
jgi:hypothetical protein